jgi:hypothetical protein
MTVLLEERVDVVEEKVDRLEAIFGQFMTRTSTALLGIERAIERMEEAAEKDRQEWNRRFEASQEELNKCFEASQEEWNRRFEAIQEEWNDRWGKLAQKFGTLVEDIVAPNMPRIAREYFGCAEIEDLIVRRQTRNKKDRSKRREFDVIVVGDGKVIINETKSVPKIDYIDQFVTALDEIEDYFPEYAGQEIIPVFASLYMREDVVNYMTKHKIYALAMGDQTMQILNLEAVRSQE